MFLLTSLALAAPKGAPFVKAFLADIAADRKVEAIEACAPAFRDRERMGCRALVDIATAAGTELELGRAVYTKSDLLVEMWMVSKRHGRFPLRLLGKRTKKTWAFVDGTDGDGPPLDTPLSLDGAKDASAPDLPREVAAVLEQLNTSEPDLTGHCANPAVCREVTHQASRFTFRVTEADTVGDRLSVGTIVNREGKPVDQIWLRFIQKNDAWMLDAVDEDGLRPSPTPETHDDAHHDEGH